MRMFWIGSKKLPGHILFLWIRVYWFDIALSLCLTVGSKHLVLRAWPPYWTSLNDFMMRRRRLLGEDFQVLSSSRWRVVEDLAVCCKGGNGINVKLGLRHYMLAENGVYRGGDWRMNNYYRYRKRKRNLNFSVYTTYDCESPNTVSYPIWKCGLISPELSRDLVWVVSHLEICVISLRLTLW